MKCRFLVVIASLVAAPCVFGQVAQTTKTPASAPKAWTQTKLPWGDPDIQGTWTSDDYIGVPLQRSADAGTRLQRNEQGDCCGTGQHPAHRRSQRSGVSGSERGGDHQSPGPLG
jgi:hypothetical protein